MEKKYKVGILGATGRVGRTAIDLIDGYLGDKLEITYVAASSNSASINPPGPSHTCAVRIRGLQTDVKN